jgi:predicted RNA-binding protein with TRAM domain
LVSNGSFDTDSDWTFTGGGVSISGGKLNFNATTREAEQSVSVENGKVYRVEYEVTDYSAGSVRVELGSTTGIPRTANGVYVEYLESAGLSKIQIDAVSFFTGSINYIKLTEVLEYVEADKCVSDWTRKRAIDLKL